MDFNQNFFELFQLEVGFEVDLERLRGQFQILQREVHPDRYADQDPRSQRLATQWSMRVNEAFVVLSKPLSRAIYLLGLANVELEQNPSLEPEFLFEQIELRENLDHLAEVKDLAGLVALLDGFTSKLTAEAQQFGECFAAGELDLATRSVYRMQFLNKLQSAAQQTEEALLDE